MVINRTKNTIKGTAFGIIQKIVTLLFPFIIRTVFIKTIGVEYLGLNSLFSSILQILNLAELGVGSALVFSMYKPIADDDQQKICALMKLYRKLYRIIGLIVLVGGLAFIPFLHLFIKGDIPSDVNIYILYCMHLASTVLTYWLFAYRNCLFQAHQRLDITSLIGICISTLTFAIQIALLLLFKNYYLHLCTSIFSAIVSNVIVALYSKKYFPDYSPQGELEKSEVKTITYKVRDLFTAKLGGVISNSFDTIVVSAFLGLTTLAVYQNYYYIVTAVSGMILIFFTSVNAGIGNFLLTNTKEQSVKLLYSINHLVLFVVNTCCCCLITMYQPFMRIWVGSEYLLEYPLVILFATYLFTYIMVRPALVFKDAAGMWREDRFRPLITSLVNLGLNLATVRILGLYGVLGSTIVSYLFVGLPWVLYNLNKHLFNINLKYFVFRELLYVFVTVVCCFACFLICSFINLDNIFFESAIYLLVSIAMSSVLFIATFFSTNENKYFMNFVKGLIGKVKNKL